MKLEVVLRPQAESDLTVTIRWYQEKNPGLGYEFRPVERSFRSIQLYPYSRNVVYRNARAMLLYPDFHTPSSIRFQRMRSSS